jgi:hypothetical protein
MDGGIVIAGLLCIVFGLLLAGNARYNPTWYTYPTFPDWRVMLLGRDLVRKLDVASGIAFVAGGVITACIGFF